MTRLGIVVSHPIQYFAPWYRYLSKSFDLEVMFCHRQDAQGQSQAGFGVEFEWDIPLLDGYSFRWLRNTAAKPGLHSFAGCDTPEVHEILKRESFDAVLVSGWQYKGYLQAVSACRRAKIPLLMRGDSHLLTPRSVIKRIAKYIPYRILLPRINAHLYVGSRNRDYLEHYGVVDDRLFFSPHFVDTQFFQESADVAHGEHKGENIRSEFGIPESASVAIFVGKLIEQKRPVDFVRACLELMNEHRDGSFHALIVGEGPQRQQLELLANGFPHLIHFAGFQNQSAMPAYYTAADWLVVPSGSETWGLVVNEAMACGIPAVVSDVVGCGPDLIDEGKTGYQFPLGDVVSLARQMQRIKEQLAANGSRIATCLQEKTKKYSMENATRGLCSAIAAIAG